MFVCAKFFLSIVPTQARECSPMCSAAQGSGVSNTVLVTVSQTANLGLPTSSQVSNIQYLTYLAPSISGITSSGSPGIVDAFFFVPGHRFVLEILVLTILNL